MKNVLMAVALGSISLTGAMADSNVPNPLASPQAVVESGNMRFTVLTPEMIRVEYSPAGKFEDRATFAIINRETDTPQYKVGEDENWLEISTDKLKLKYRKGSVPDLQNPSPDNLSITKDMNGKEVVWYPGLTDNRNLLGTYRTLDRNNGDSVRPNMEQGVISRSGWAVIDDSPATKRADGSRSLAFTPEEDGIDWVAQRTDPDAMDLYFMGYGHDYKKALKDFTSIAGKIPLPPDYVFGYWYSKYENYSADDFRNIISNLQENDINSDVMILDMDWHWNGEQGVSDGRGGWTGWSWNTKLIPDPDGLLKDIHDANLHIALNLHPADGVDPHEDIYEEMARDMGLDPSNKERIPWKLEDKQFAKSFFKNFIRPFEKQGVDFWWLDWQQYLTSPYTDGLGETFWCNHVFFNEMKNNRPDRRPLIFHRWGGLGSHRYQIGFSGDTFINYPTLAFEPYFTATASNVGYGYWGHDLGGHMSDKVQDVNDPELLLRWIQFGVFTPIFRTHATKGTQINRLIWTYDNFDKMNQAVKLRYALFPYLYTMARKCYDTGVGICRPLYYEHPEVDEAYTNEGEYYFGDDILVAPVVEASENGISKKTIWFPEGNWWSVAHNKMINGGKSETFEFTLDEIPYFYKEGSVIVHNPASVKSMTERPDNLIVNIVAGKSGEFELYEDSGDSNDYDHNYATTLISHKREGKKGVYTISARKGSSDGLASERGYELKIFNTDKPKGKAVVDGKKVDVKYDAASRCTIVNLPKASCSIDRKVTVSY
ncbi:MAG: glycoside hydrolase family 31 protein [Muribaculaceae bacterium]|nr:glycoside hydrolase family 31 protein [Muribaculaceae bacterium]